MNKLNEKNDISLEENQIIEPEVVEEVEEIEEVITSEMYIKSLIKKESNLNMKSIKLDNIDDISMLNEFTELRRVSLYNMSGSEELSVIHELRGVNELLI
jgi:hypothetical protein